MKYLKVWTSFREVIGNLKHDEIGRLFEMMLTYAETGEEPEVFIGNEFYLWPVARQMIDLASEKAETLRENGLKGGRPANQNKPTETKQNQTEPNETSENQTKAYKEKKRKEIERKEKLSSSFMDDDEGHQIQTEQDQILDAAGDAGFKMSNDVRASLIRLYAEHGKQKVLDSIRSCSEHGACNLAYLRAVLKGNPKKPPGKVLPAQDFNQRDYSGVQGEMMSELAREIAEMKAGVG